MIINKVNENWFDQNQNIVINNFHANSLEKNQLLVINNFQLLLTFYDCLADRSEMHRYKLSPRGKLYLKTDAEGKLKKLLI